MNLHKIAAALRMQDFIVCIGNDVYYYHEINANEDMLTPAICPLTLKQENLLGYFGKYTIYKDETH